ncbi:MAG TPA: IPTL-CTERM sorting domain-containing protein [Bryobacteraceae bacterium]|nr:IPTL-CTERM sorting domain-containing protein [Bryobacteraceae bacterium]
MRRVLISALGVVLLSVGLTVTASAATEAQKMTAILNGLAHLDLVQCGTDGSWSYGGGCGGGYSDAMTGAALFAFQTQKTKWPTNLATKYAADVTNGVNYLLANASTATVSTNDAGQNICPGGSGSCTAIYWNISGNETYATGFVAASIDLYGSSVGTSNVATTSGPLSGLTWLQIAQGMTNAYAAAQATATNGSAEGGWRYDLPSDGDADMSTTQWGALASGYNESVGASTPAFVKTLLQVYMTNESKDGPACYQGSGTSCGIGPTNSENGAYLVANAFAGGGSTANALNFLNANWKTTPSGTWYGNFGHTYAMWSSYKGLEAAIGLKDTTHITNLFTNCGIPTNAPGSGVCNWWEDYNEWLVNQTTATATDSGSNKYWTGDPDEEGWQDPMSTAVFTAIIGAAALPSTITQTPTSVPAVGQWGLVALGILLVVFAAMKLRKPQTT